MIRADRRRLGAWRRNPDAKRRMRPGALAQRIKGQDEILDSARRLMKPGGRIVYVTCSLIKPENEDRVFPPFRRRSVSAVLRGSIFALGPSRMNVRVIH